MFHVRVQLILDETQNIAVVTKRCVSIACHNGFDERFQAFRWRHNRSLRLLNIVQILIVSVESEHQDVE